jgi:hypothetical protein
MDSEKYIGLDVHQATIVVAVTEPKGLRPLLHFWCFLNRSPRYSAQTLKHSNRSPIRASPSRGGAGGPAVAPLGAAS